MERKSMRTSALASIAVAVMLVAAWEAKAQDTKKQYPSMAPLEQYLIPDRSEERKLGRSAAPESISGDPRTFIRPPHAYATPSKLKTRFLRLLDPSSISP